jgi:hypothetical protein
MMSNEGDEVCVVRSCWHGTSPLYLHKPVRPDMLYGLSFATSRGEELDDWLEWTSEPRLECYLVSMHA